MHSLPWKHLPAVCGAALRGKQKQMPPPPPPRWHEIRLRAAQEAWCTRASRTLGLTCDIDFLWRLGRISQWWDNIGIYSHLAKVFLELVPASTTYANPHKIERPSLGAQWDTRPQGYKCALSATDHANLDEPMLIVAHPPASG